MESHPCKARQAADGKGEPLQSDEFKELFSPYLISNQS